MAVCENVSITLYILVVGIFEVCEDLLYFLVHFANPHSTPICFINV